MGRSSMSMAFLLAALLLAATGESLTKRPDCQASCGGVDIPYPFGIGKEDCFRQGFEIVCRNNTTPVLAGTTQVIRVLNLSVMPRPEARVMLPVAWRCYNVSTRSDITGEFDGKVNLNNASVYRISNTANELFVLGCNTFVYTNSGPPSRGYEYSYYSGCMAYANDSQSARDEECTGVGCCHVDIPSGLTDTWMRFYSWTHRDMGFCPCDYGFMVEKDHYTFRVADLHMDKRASMPLRLDWAIRDSTVNSTASLSCAQAQADRTGAYTCVSDHSECVNSTNGPGYVCNCTTGYEGNPYLLHGCTNINECTRPQDFPCNGECKDTDGWYDCKCPPGYQSIGDPRKNPCNPKFSLAAKLALGISVGSLLVVALLLAFIMLQKRKLDKLFEQNGGKVLQNVKGLTIFTKEELTKITKNNSEFLGNGSFGKVYKGTLPDNTTVAVKESIMVNEETIGEFTKEVEIQTQMIYKNILKLIGCCLEVDVPMLVYEFAANGSLQNTLHGNKTQKLSLDLRLDIAIGSAEGLRYMHSNKNQAIRHGDVKPDNILLDDKLTPKIADFGLTRLVKEEYVVKTVIGCMGYIDPVFMKTGRLTHKNDVYSFGAILLELITRKTNVYDDDRSLIIEFCKVYGKEKSGRAMFDKEIIVTEEDTIILEKIGKLAIECLNEDIEARPDMTETAEQLVVLRRERKLGNTHNRTLSQFEDISMDDSPNNTDISGTSNATYSVPSTPTS